jgi:hypothetical protein
LGPSLEEPIYKSIGGSVALILGGVLRRKAQKIDFVDEAQANYLPDRWDARVSSLGNFGKLQAYLLSSDDIFLSKLFSQREKDRADLRAIVGHLDRARLVRLLQEFAGALLGEKRLREHAGKNWYVLYGEALPR